MSEPSHYEIPIVPETVQNMCDRAFFRMPTYLGINGSFQTSLTRISLCLQPQAYGQTYEYGSVVNTSFVEPYLSISGFPRELWTHDDPLSPTLNAEDEKEELGSPRTAEHPITTQAPRSLSDPAGETPTLSRKMTRLFRMSTPLGTWTGSNSETQSVTSLAISDGESGGIRESTDATSLSPSTKSSLLY